MYGLTEIESINLLKPVYLFHGMLNEELNKELMDYMNAFCEFKAEKCKTDAYNKYWYSIEDYGSSLKEVLKSRDVMLDILSDARSAAPMSKMARYHSILNSQSYFYIFGHVTASRNAIVSYLWLEVIFIRLNLCTTKYREEIIFFCKN